MAPDSGVEEGGDMNKKQNKSIKYTDEPIKLGEVVKDFLPSPEELAKAEEVVKVTISLSSKSVDFFKKASSKHKMPYQRIIRRLLDEYISRQSNQEYGMVREK